MKITKIAPLMIMACLTGMSAFGRGGQANPIASVETRMKDMVLPAIMFKPPATIIDAVDFFRQASKDYDRSDIPPERRGLNFVLMGLAAGGDVVEDSGSEMPQIPNCPASNISLYEALKLVCELTRFKFEIDGQVVKVMPIDWNVTAGNNNGDESVFEHAKHSIAIVSTGDGRGSGFIVKMDGKARFITNEHVARGGMPFSVKTLDGKLLKFEPMIEVADDRDLVRMTLREDCAALELAEYTPKKNHPIHVYGNSDGLGVATFLDGKINGVGPNLLEVDCMFVRGNSGSAVLDDGGKVLGVATYARNLNEPEDWTKKGTRFNDVRRFAVRLNDIKWRPISWQRYVKCSEAMTACNELVDFCIAVCNEKKLVRKADFDRQIREGKFRNFSVKNTIATVVKKDEELAKTAKQLERLIDELNNVHVEERTRKYKDVEVDSRGDPYVVKYRTKETVRTGTMEARMAEDRCVSSWKRYPRLLKECAKAHRSALQKGLSLAVECLRNADFPAWQKGVDRDVVGIHYHDTLVDYETFFKHALGRFDDLFDNEMYGTQIVRLPERLKGRL